MSKREEAKAKRALAKIAGRGCDGATVAHLAARALLSGADIDARYF